MKNNSRGFTLLEILLVVGIISILAGIVIIAINPSKQLASVRNTERKTDLKTLYNAMNQFYIDRGYYPASSTLSTTLTEVCDTGAVASTSVATDGTSCGTMINLSYDLVPTYIVAIPKDPQGPTAFLNQIIPTVYAAAGGTGYKIATDANRKIILTTARRELEVEVAIGTSTAVVAEGGGGCDSVCLALRGNLVAYWPLDTDTNDYSGNSHDLTIASGTSATSSKKVGAGAYSFDGLTSKMVATDYKGPGTFPHSVGLWFKAVSGPRTDQSFITWGNHGNSCINFAFYTVTGQTWIYNCSGGYPLGGTGYNDGNWHYLVYTADVAKVSQIYVDGAPVGASTTQTHNSVNNIDDVILGDWREGYNRQFSGIMDEVAIWDKALSSGEVVQLYNSGAGRSLMP